MGAWEKLFLGKDFIYSTGKYVCRASESGSGVCAEGGCSMHACAACVWARVGECPGRCVGLLSQDVGKEKETVEEQPAVGTSKRSWRDRER